MELSEGFLQQINDLLLNNQEQGLILLIILGLIAGLVSSLSPCVLSLLPLNLAYIGTANINNRKEAFIKAGQFVLGVSLILSLLGVFGSFAFAVFNQYKGLINLCIGVFILFMALSVMNLIKLPLPQFITKMPEANPFVIGLLFALVSSPCSSPVLVSVLSVAANTGSTANSLSIMFAYSLGYTAIIFFASLFTGLSKQLSWFKTNHDLVTQISAGILAITGMTYAYIGITNL